MSLVRSWWSVLSSDTAFTGLDWVVSTVWKSWLESSESSWGSLHSSEGWGTF